LREKSIRWQDIRPYSSVAMTLAGEISLPYEFVTCQLHLLKLLKCDLCSHLRADIRQAIIDHDQLMLDVAELKIDSVMFIHYHDIQNHLLDFLKQIETGMFC